jgi:hypothetical protein
VCLGHGAQPGYHAWHSAAGPSDVKGLLLWAEVNQDLPKIGILAQAARGHSAEEIVDGRLL